MYPCLLLLISSMPTKMNIIKDPINTISYNKLNKIFFGVLT